MLHMILFLSVVSLFVCCTNCPRKTEPESRYNFQSFSRSESAFVGPGRMHRDRTEGLSAAQFCVIG
jgi:hypothetical protein